MKKTDSSIEKKFRVHFTNPGSSSFPRQKTPLMTKEEAEESKDFLKFQGAKNVSIREEAL